MKLLQDHPLGTGTPSVTNPMIPCMDGSGVVAEVGSNVKRFKVGDCVFFTKNDHPGNAAAQWIVVPEQLVGRKPRAMAFKDAACLGSAVSAVLEGMEWMEFKGSEPKTVLVLGGASDVGSFAIQYCKMFGWFVLGMPRAIVCVCVCGSH